MQGRRIGGRVKAIGNGNDACGLDLLLFFHRHPRVVLTSERLALYVGYEIANVTQSLDTLITSGLLTRRQRPSATASLYVLAVEGQTESSVSLAVDGVLQVLHEGARCVTCIARSAGIAPRLARNILAEIGLEAVVTEAFGRCEGCGALTDTYEAPPSDAAPAVDLAGFGILVVDDHEDTMDLYAGVLEQAGAIVQRATNLLEALNLFQRVQIGLVVTDIAMSGGSGWDVLRELRKRAPWVPFVAVTGQLFPDGRELVDRGFAAALLKPIDPAELVAVVGHLIGHQRRV